VGKVQDAYGYPVYKVKPTCQGSSSIYGNPSIRLEALVKGSGGISGRFAPAVTVRCSPR